MGKQGKRRGKWKISKELYRYDLSLSAGFLLFENVKGLIKTQKHREYFEELKRELKQNGYILTEQLMNSLDFGVPQDRERIFMIGVLKGTELARKVICVNDTFAFPWNTNLPYDSAVVKMMNWPKPQIYRENSKRKFKYNVPRNLTVEEWFRKIMYIDILIKKMCLRLKVEEKKYKQYKKVILVESPLSVYIDGNTPRQLLMEITKCIFIHIEHVA